MIAVLIALILTFAPTSTEVPTTVESTQSAQEQALEASAWESLAMLGTIETITEETMVEYSHTIKVGDEGYTISPVEFAIIDPYDDTYIHVFKVTPISHT